MAGYTRTISTTAIAVALAATSAFAQSNSIASRLGIGPRTPQAPPPPPPPAREVLLTGPAPLPPISNGQDRVAQPNPDLLRESLIAGELPQPRTFQLHDPLTVIVRQDLEATSNADLKSEKKWEIESALRKWFRLQDGNLRGKVFAGEPGVDFTFDNKYEGKGETGRSDSLTTRITAEIIDVKPNGNLVLQARSRLKIDETVQTKTLTGLCRADDVTPQNTILSTQLADLDIVVENTGPERDAARRGWLYRGFDLLRPL